MPNFTSPVIGTGDPSLGDLFPATYPEVERFVYEYVLEAAQPGAIAFGSSTSQTLPQTFGRPAPLSLFAERAGAQIPVVRGWPPFPGKVPAIGVAVGTDTTDDQLEQMSGGFAGTVERHAPDGTFLGSADYYTEPIYSPVMVVLIHENRDERDRLHAHLQALLFPLRRKLPDRSAQIRKVRVDGEKQEAQLDEQPFVMYVSVFTVHVYYEMWVPEDVTGPDGQILAVEPIVHPGVYVPATDPPAAPAPPEVVATDPITSPPTFPFPNPD